MALPNGGRFGAIAGQNSRQLKLHRLATANGRLRVAQHGWIRVVERGRPQGTPSYALLKRASRVAPTLSLPLPASLARERVG